MPGGRRSRSQPTVPDSEPDGPMWVVATLRYVDAWNPGSDGFPVMVWQLQARPEPPVIVERPYRSPTDQPQAWCTVQSHRW